LDALREAGSAIGLAFQIQDDILDETASTEILGKQQGRDRMLGKSTFPNLLGLSASEAMARDLVKTAHEALARLPGDTSALKGLATLSVERNA
jgi:geranylgeranyl pyrophosphate synthase